MHTSCNIVEILSITKMVLYYKNNELYIFKVPYGLYISVVHCVLLY